MYKNLKTPLNAQVELTTACTHACGHCYNYWRNHGDSSHSPKATHIPINTTRSIIKSLAEAELFEVTFTGGEPLLNVESLKAGLIECQNTGLRVSLNSNLFLASRSIIQELKKLGLRHILTTILAPTAELHDQLAGRNGAFAAVTENIRVAREEGIRITSNMVVSRRNLEYIIPTAEIAASLGVNCFAATKAGHPGGCVDFKEVALDRRGLETALQALSKAKQLYNLQIDVMEPVPTCSLADLPVEPEYVRRKCAAGVTTLTISVDGEVRPCSHLEVKCGNMLTESIQNIWQQMVSWRNGNLLPDTCRFCKLLRVCGGGCRMEAKMQNHKFEALDPYSQPEHVSTAAKKVISIKRQERKAFPVFSFFQIAPDLKSRTESFGATLFSPRASYLFLSHAGLAVLNQFKQGIRYEFADSKINWGSIDPPNFLKKLALANVLDVFN